MDHTFKRRLAFTRRKLSKHGYALSRPDGLQAEAFAIGVVFGLAQTFIEAVS
jgi:hypothetical protein